MGWIKCSERPPEEGMDIIAYWDDGEITKFNYRNKNNLLVYLGSDRYTGITHWQPDIWQPFPDPPEDEG